MPEVDDVGNDLLDVLEVVDGIRVEESIDDSTFCRNDIEPTLVEWLTTYQHDDDGFINDELEDARSTSDSSSSSDKHHDQSSPDND